MSASGPVLAPRPLPRGGWGAVLSSAAYGGSIFSGLRRVYLQRPTVGLAALAAFICPGPVQPSAMLDDFAQSVVAAAEVSRLQPARLAALVGLVEPGVLSVQLG